MLLLALMTSVVVSDVPTSVQLYLGEHQTQLIGWKHRRLPYTNADLYFVKDSSMKWAVIDVHGRLLDVNQIKAYYSDARNARLQATGTLSQELYDWYNTAPHWVDTFKVVIWPRADFPLPPPPDNYSDEEAERRLIDVQNWVREAQAPVLSFLSELNPKDVWASSSDPSIYAELTPSALGAVFLASGLIDLAERADGEIELFSTQIASRSARLDSFWANGNTGLGERIVVVEAGRLESCNPSTSGCNPNTQWRHLFLAPTQGGNQSVVFPLSGTQVDPDDVSDVLVHRHALVVAGAAAGNFIFSYSGAPQATVINANAPVAHPGEAELKHFHQAAATATLFNHRIFNHSYGSLLKISDGIEPWAKAMDFRTVALSTTEVHACGNEGEPFSGFPRGARAACQEFNSVHVGAYDNNQTAPWTDDNAWLKSSYVNPSSTDRELPEVSAPGVNLKSLAYNSDDMGYGWYAPRVPPGQTQPAAGFGDYDPNQSSSGTSIAAPLVAAGVAMAFSEDPTLKNYPEAVRAALLGTALNQRARGAWPDVPEFGPMKIGSAYAQELRVAAGGVSFDALKKLVTGTKGTLLKLYLQESSYVAGQMNWATHPTTFQISTTEPRVRVAMAWSSRVRCATCPSHGFTVGDSDKDGLESDLDFEILSGTMIVARSYSFDNSYEIADFETAGLTMPLTIRILAFGPRVSERVGLAVFPYDPSGQSP